MKEYIVTDQDIEKLRSDLKQEVFWNDDIIDKWVSSLKLINSVVGCTDNSQNIIDVFNLICVDLPRVEKLTQSRKSAINQRIKEHTLEVVVDVFKITAASDYLNGKKVNWKANFDWIINPNNFVKILEGNYKNIENVGNSNQPKSDSDHKKSAIDEVAKRFGIRQ